MFIVDLLRLEAPGLQKVREHYAKLTAAADASAHGSPANEAKAAFERDWAADPEAVTRAAEAAATTSENEVPAGEEVVERHAPRRGHKASAKGEQS
jgi:hypothetical protein